MGRAQFRFHHPEASTVAVAGSFNGWSTAVHPMQRSGDALWTLEVDLPPGRHEYKFCVDGQEWCHDPEAPTVPNPLGSEMPIRLEMRE